MKKVIALIDDCKEIKHLFAKISERRIFLAKKMEAIDKQKEKILKDDFEQSKQDWEFIIDWLKTIKKLPEYYNEQQYTLSFNMEENTVCIEKDDENNDDFKLVPIPVPKRFIDLMKTMLKKDDE